MKLPAPPSGHTIGCGSFNGQRLYTADQLRDYATMVLELSNGPVDAMTTVADRYAHRLAMYLELVLMQQDNDNSAHTRWWNEAMQCLGEYRSAMSQIHERESPTWMGEPKL